jgi:Carboxypeptidase regulatory-like domain
MMKRNLHHYLAIVIAALTWIAVPVWPQSSNSSFRGVVQDQTKAVIPGVAVRLVNQATGAEFKTVSNEAGVYVFPVIQPGPYKITAENPGMARFEATATAEPQLSATVDIVLRHSRKYFRREACETGCILLLAQDV